MEKKIHQAILKNLPFAYAMHRIILDDRGKPLDFEYLEVNDAFEKFSQLKNSEIIGKSISELIPNIKLDAFDWISHYGNIAINGGESEFEQYFEDQKKWYKVKIFSPLDGYVISFLVDITQELEKKNLYRSILSSLEEGILSTDLEGNITMINAATEKFIGYKKEINEKENPLSVFNNIDEDSVQQINSKVHSVINTGIVIKEEETTHTNILNVGAIRKVCVW